MKKFTFILILLLFPFVCFAHEVLNVAVSSNFINCCKHLNTAFTKEQDETLLVKVTTGSSGSLYSQIRNGADYEVFVSADTKYPEKLVKDGFADKEHFIKYAKGKLVIWTKRSDLDTNLGIDILKDKNINKIAVPSPEMSPYGYIAKSVMDNQEIWDLLQYKIVFGENSFQTSEIIDTGKADIGIIPLSLLRTPGMRKVGTYFEIPYDMYQPIIQGAVITSCGTKNPFAEKYLKFIQSEKAVKILRQYGYELP